MRFNTHQTSRYGIIAIVLLLAIVTGFYGCEDVKKSATDMIESEMEKKETPDTDDMANAVPCEGGYPNYDGPIPPGTDSASLYYLNQNWPQEPVNLPASVTERLHSYLPINKDNVADIQFFLRAYVFEQLVPSSFSQRGTNWFAVPNMGKREALHGMYDGNNIDPFVWGPEQTKTSINFTTDLYNEVSAYTIGQVWSDCDKAPLINKETNQFPEGSIVIKLAMSSLSNTEAPFLEGAFSWQIYADPSGATTGAAGDTTFHPEMLDVRLIQMDMIIKDSVIAPETGWMFSTFVYDTDATPVDMPAGTPANKVGLYKMIPLGVQWGNDPGVLVREELKETVLNPHWVKKDVELINNTLGLNGRLSGPIDDIGNRGSCMQCHGSAEWNTNPLEMAENKNIFATLQFPSIEWANAEKTTWLQNFSGLQSYGNTEINDEITEYIQNVVGLKMGDDWVGMDYDFVMTAAAMNALQQQNKVDKSVQVVGKHH